MITWKVSHTYVSGKYSSLKIFFSNKNVFILQLKSKSEVFLFQLAQKPGFLPAGAFTAPLKAFGRKFQQERERF